MLRPEFAVLAAARAAQARGARLASGSRVDGLEPDDDGVTVVTADDRRFRVRQAVVTAGPWTGRFAPTLAQHVAAQKLVMTWYRPAGDLAPYRPDAFPIFIRDTEGPQVFGLPTLDEGSVKVAPHASYGELADADDLDRNVDAAVLEPINGAVARYLPGLVPTPVRVSAYMDAYTTDGHAMVGAMPGVPNTWLPAASPATGSRWPRRSARSPPSLVQHGRTGLPIGHLDPARFLG